MMIASSILKLGCALGLGLGRKLYLPVFLGLYPKTIGGSVGGIGGLSVGGGLIVKGLSLTSKLNDVLSSEDVLSIVVLSSAVVITVSWSVVFPSSVRISVIVASSVLFSVGAPNRTSPNSVSQACAYQSSWVVLTSGSGS